jgi:hypothetical protein
MKPRMHVEILRSFISFFCGHASMHLHIYIYIYIYIYKCVFYFRVLPVWA